MSALVQQKEMTLRIKRGKKSTDAPLATLNQASAVQQAAFWKMIESGGSPSSLPKFLIVVDGKEVAYVSQNGKVWEGTPQTWVSGSLPLYVPES